MKHQHISCLVIISFILMTSTFDQLVIAELLRGRRPREWSPIVILKGVLVIFYGHGKRNGSRARAPYIHTYIRTYVAFHDILT